MKKDLILNILFVLFMALICLPLIQSATGIIKERELKGAFELMPSPNFSWENWFNEGFQDSSTTFIRDNIGLRKSMIRVNNQVDYTLFRKTNVKIMVFGKEDYLFEEGYLINHMGMNYLGEKEINDRVSKIKAVQDTLSSLGKHMLVFLAPGKDCYYPEYIPDEWWENKSEPDNFTAYIETMNRYRADYLDFNTWFIQAKDTTKYPLFPKTGIHWSRYGEILALRKLLNELESRLGNEIANVPIGTIETSKEMRDTDDDIEQAMNLLFNIPDKEMAYPQFRFEIDSTAMKPKVITVGDSFWWGIYNTGFTAQAFTEGQFWFMNEMTYEPNKDPVPTSQKNLSEEIESTDVFLIITTTTHLWDVGFGFIDRIYFHFYPENESPDS